MKLCNEVITVFNARVDPGTGVNTWIPTVVRGASWFATDASTVDASRIGYEPSELPNCSTPLYHWEIYEKWRPLSLSEGR